MLTHDFRRAGSAWKGRTRDAVTAPARAFGRVGYRRFAVRPGLKLAAVLLRDAILRRGRRRMP